MPAQGFPGQVYGTQDTQQGQSQNATQDATQAKQDQNENPQTYEELSEEDKKILEEAHANKDNPEHPANEKHPDHHDFLKKIPVKRLLGMGARAAGSAFN